MTGPEITTMMGRLSGQEPMFFGFQREDHVPADHLLCRVDAALDFGFVRRALAPYYSATGRPSVDPELMMRMLLIDHLHGIRSERRLCDEVYLNLAYRWFCCLGLDGNVLDDVLKEPSRAFPRLAYDETADAYTCSEGRQLRHRGYERRTRTHRQRIADHL